jgi:ABC-type branched-subunit amino acid transport system substrate-binding protein
MNLGGKRVLATVAAAALLVLGAGCSSSKSSTSAGSTASGSAAGSSGGGKSITVGVLTDVTGLAASGNKTSIQGVQAGVAYAKDQGYNIHYVVGDTTSSPAGALTAAQTLVDQDHVDAVVAVSAVAFGGAPFLTQHHIPVVGLQEDGPEWTTSLNMFSEGGIIRTNLVPTVYGDFFKMEGVTTVGTIGYSISPSSSEYAKGVADSAKHAGLKVGYVNANFPFGSTNVEPIAIAMKNAGVDGVYAPIDPNTAFALVTALRQLGANVKVALFPTGYGGDLTQAGPNASQVAQGVYFTIPVEPVELHTSATQLFQKYSQAAGIAGEPTEASYDGWGSIGLLVQALRGAGSHPTSSSLLTALSNIHSWTNLGLWAGKSLDLNDRTNTQIAGGPGNCAYMVKYSGSAFQLVPGADPICGTIIPGLNETPG